MEGEERRTALRGERERERVAGEKEAHGSSSRFQPKNERAIDKLMLLTTKKYKLSTLLLR